MKSFYAKNQKQPISSVEDINNENAWVLTRNNSVSRVYPNANKTLLAGNLLIGAKESEGGFNTNLVSIKNPT
jgi:hypothetical protein